jgi:hypothetical protein
MSASASMGWPAWCGTRGASRWRRTPEAGRFATMNGLAAAEMTNPANASRG